MAVNQRIRTAKRLRIYKRDGQRCVWCVRAVRITGDQAPDMATLDHVLPRAEGGSNHHGNLVTCCHTCNSVRQNRRAEAFALLLARATQDADSGRGLVFHQVVTILSRVCRAMGRELPP